MKLEKKSTIVLPAPWGPESRARTPCLGAAGPSRTGSAPCATPASCPRGEARGPGLSQRLQKGGQFHVEESCRLGPCLLTRVWSPEGPRGVQADHLQGQAGLQTWLRGRVCPQTLVVGWGMPLPRLTHKPPPRAAGPGSAGPCEGLARDLAHFLWRGLGCPLTSPRTLQGHAPSQPLGLRK